MSISAGFSYDATGKTVVNYTVTNHGLIAASSASLTLPASVGGYTVTPLLARWATSPPSHRWWCRW